MRSLRRGWLVLVWLAVSACGGSGGGTVPIGQIPPDKKLVDLTPGEQQGMCDWSEEIARQKLAGANCNGIPIQITSCGPHTPATCPATVSQYQGCLPNLLDRWAANPCDIISLGLSMSAAVDYVNATPGCNGLADCVVSINN